MHRVTGVAGLGGWAVIMRVRQKEKEPSEVNEEGQRVRRIWHVVGRKRRCSSSCLLLPWRHVPIALALLSSSLRSSSCVHISLCASGCLPQLQAAALESTLRTYTHTHTRQLCATYLLPATCMGMCNS